LRFELNKTNIFIDFCVKKTKKNKEIGKTAKTNARKCKDRQVQGQENQKKRKKSLRA
jgi:hypothetical protein